METIIEEKFWLGIEKTNFCWNWIGNLGWSGLPLITATVDGKQRNYSPRRISLTLQGKEPPSTDDVQPLICRNKLCVNPAHLVYGDEGRFFAKVQKLSEKDGGCWVWIGSQDKNMYGRFRPHDEKNTTYAHIYSWELHNGKLLNQSGTIVVCHKCDHPYCVNPDHLFIGLRSDNSKDRDEKGRQACGEKLPQATVSAEQVRLFRDEYTAFTHPITGSKYGAVAALAKKHSIPEGTMRGIISGTTWKNVK